MTCDHAQLRTAGACALALGLLSQGVQCRPALSAPSEEGEACRSCKFHAMADDAATELHDALCLVNAEPFQSTHSSEEILRITYQMTPFLGGSKNPARYRGWDSDVEALTVERLGDVCEAWRSVRWWRPQAACEIVHTRIPLTDQDCNDLFVCLHAATPAGTGVSSVCDRPGADGSEYTAEVYDSDHRGACVWFDPPPCLAMAIYRHGEYRVSTP
jgi:hypothetical protein